MFLVSLKKAFIKPYRENQAGTAAVEFSLIFPVLLFGYLGAVSAFGAYRAQSAVTRASTTIVDLVTRESQINEMSRDRIFAVADAMLTDVTNGTVSVTFTSISNPISEPEEEARILDWSYSSVSGDELDEADIEKLDLPTIAKGDSIIVSRISVPYKPQFLLETFSEVNLVYTTYRRPRFILRIPSLIDA